MQSETLSQIEERLKRLPPEKLVVVLDFVSYLAERHAMTPTGPLYRDWAPPEEDEARWRLSSSEADLEAGYRAMVADAEREREAREWIEVAPDEALE